MTMTTDQTTADTARRLAAVERLCSGRPGYHTITVKALLTAMSEAAEDVSAAVPVPPPTNRAAVRAAALREAADFVGNDDDCDCGGCDSCVPNKLAAELRRRAAEEQPAETQAPSCPDPIECGHEAALGLAEERLDRVRAVAEAWARPSMSSQSRLAGEHLLRVLDTDAAPAVVEQPDTQEAS